MPADNKKDGIPNDSKKGKQIWELEPAESFDMGDLLLIRKTGLGSDKNINYTNFVKSIGSSFLGGFISEIDAGNENKIILNHAGGITLNKYYNGMKISFISPITSTDTVQIKIAGLDSVELLNLISKDPTAIKQGEYVEAIYSVNDEGQGTFYCTNNYIINPRSDPAVQEPQKNQAQPLPEGQAHQAPLPVPAVPESQEIIVTVGPNGRFKTIKLAIRALTAEYGKNGSDKPVIISLQEGYIINETINLMNMNLSWITITSQEFITVNIDNAHGNKPFFELTNANAPIIAAKFSVRKMSYFVGGKNSTVSLKGANFNFMNDASSSGGAMGWITDTTINIESSTFDFGGYKHEIFSDQAQNNVFNFTNSQFNNFDGTLYHTGNYIGDQTRCNIYNCQIKSTSTSKRVIDVSGSGDFNIVDTTITGASSQLTYFYISKPLTLKNCSITSSVSSAQSIVVLGNYGKTAPVVIIDGGNYQTIVAGQYSKITLTNSPTIANRSTISDGQFINK